MKSNENWSITIGEYTDLLHSNDSVGYVLPTSLEQTVETMCQTSIWKLYKYIFLLNNIILKIYCNIYFIFENEYQSIIACYY